jgi:Sulfate permease and related transporters (MFS superfamily)
MALGLGLLILLRVLRRLAPRLPGPLVAVALGLLLSRAFDFQALGVKLVGGIPRSLPVFALPLPQNLDIDDFALAVLGILLVSFSSGIVTARSFGLKNRYDVDANRELIGFGAANIASGLFGGFPVTSSDSRTAVNDAVGGKTQLAGLVAAAALMAVVLFFGEAPGRAAHRRPRRGSHLRRPRPHRYPGLSRPVAPQPGRIPVPSSES